METATCEEPLLSAEVLDGCTAMGIATFLTVCTLLISRRKRSAMRLEDTWLMCSMETRTTSSSPSSTSSTPRMGLLLAWWYGYRPGQGTSLANRRRHGVHRLQE